MELGFLTQFIGCWGDRERIIGYSFNDEDCLLAAKDDRMCVIQIKLIAQQTAAESAYRSSVARMKETRGQGFERAWRLMEDRRTLLVRACRVLREHEQEHLCGMQNLSQPAPNVHVQF
jgi:hypothetical protein